MSVKQLEHALAARVVVEQAIGVLTERQRSSPRQAFERLRKVARSRGRKVHDLSREIVMSATDPACRCRPSSPAAAERRRAGRRQPSRRAPPRPSRDDLVELVAPRAGLVRVLVDGHGAAELADALAPGLRTLGRTPLRVRAQDFLRPAGERFEQGREDEEHFRTRWLDAAALEREVLAPAVDGAYLPALWDAERDRSYRRAREPVPPGAVVLVDGLFLLGRALTCELSVHLALSPAALRRRGVPQWQVPAFVAYDREVRPGGVCDVLVRAEDARRPAVLVR